MYFYLQIVIAERSEWLVNDESHGIRGQDSLPGGRGGLRRVIHQQTIVFIVNNLLHGNWILLHVNWILLCGDWILPPPR